MFNCFHEGTGGISDLWLTAAIDLFNFTPADKSEVAFDSSAESDLVTDVGADWFLELDSDSISTTFEDFTCEGLTTDVDQQHFVGLKRTNFVGFFRIIRVCILIRVLDTE